MVLDRDFHTEVGPDSGVSGLKMRERDVLLEKRRPAPARRVPDLCIPVVDGHARAPALGRKLGWKAYQAVQSFERIPIHLEPSELPLGTTLLFSYQSFTSHERLLVELDRPAQPQLERGGLPVLDDGPMRRYIVDPDQHQTGLDARDIESEHARRENQVGVSGFHDPIPESLRVAARRPDLVTEVTGIPGSRDLDRHTPDLTGRVTEEAQVVCGPIRGVMQDPSRGRPLEGQRGQVVRDIPNRNVHPERVIQQPPQVRLGRSEPEGVVGEPSECSVVHHLAVGVTPGCIEHLVQLAFGDIPGHDAVQESLGVRPLDPVLVEGRDVDQCSRVADRPVLAVVMELVGTCREIPRPAPPILRLAQRCGTRVEGSGPQHGAQSRPRPIHGQDICV